MSLREEQAFCRICLGHCGMRLTIDTDDRIVDIRGDKDNPLTKGYACFKGRQAEEFHHGESRLRRPLRRNGEGGFDPIGSEQLLDEVAAKLAALIDEHGPESVGVYFGNGSILNATAVSMQAALLDAIGSSQRYTSYTIDQSAKTISFERLGGWAGGNLQLEQCDVLMVIGSNPLVSHGLLGQLASAPPNLLREFTERGLKLITIDPRRTETGQHASIALQPLPGHDPLILAGLIGLILEEGWEDRAFCARYVGAEAMTKLAAALKPFTEDVVERAAGLDPGDLRRTAELFARDCTQGGVWTGTGPSMAPHSNLMQHLADTLNVICGRFTRPGDEVRSLDMMTPPPQFRAEVIPPSRTTWNTAPSRIRGLGLIGGEKATPTLADEILTPGPGQIRALISCGGNLANLGPDQQKFVRAFSSLELLVTIDPFMSNTARLAHYVVPPLMQYERADLPVSAYGFAFFPAPWVGYSPAVLKPPKGSDLIDEWYFFWGVAQRLGVTLNFAGTDLDMATAPSTDDLLALRAQHPLAPLAQIKRRPASGRIYSEARSVVLPPRPEATATFEVIPDDVAEELDEILAAAYAAAPEGGHLSNGERFTHLLSTRRMRNFYNSIGLYVTPLRERDPTNPAYLNPGDLAGLGLTDGDLVEIVSDHARITAVVEGDDGVRSGVVSMAVGWGALPGEPVDAAAAGASTNMLISTDRDTDPINAMARQSAIPVNLVPVVAAASIT